MERFKDSISSHAHSLSILTQLLEYDSWLDEIDSIADMGCGAGLDSIWWANLKTRDDSPQPHNYKVFAIDRDNPPQIKQHKIPPNVSVVIGDFTKKLLKKPVDLIWSHDSFQYTLNPFETLRVWNNSLTKNGMLVLVVSQNGTVVYNRFVDRAYSGCFFNYSITNLLYLLAVSGFDCSSMYVLKKANDPWIQIVIRKGEKPIINPEFASWYVLYEHGVLDVSAAKSVLENGFLRAEDLLLPWLDRQLYRIDYVESSDKPFTVPSGPMFRLPESGPRILKR